MIKKLLPLLMLVLGLGVFTSCSDNNNEETITTQTFSNFYGFVRNMTDGSVMSYNGVGYQVDINYTDLTADIAVVGLKLPNGDTYPTLVFRDVPWTMDGNTRRMYIARITPQAVGMSNVPTISHFEFRLIDRILSDGIADAYCPAVSCSMVVDNIYDFSSTFFPQQLYGETKSISSLNATEFKTDGTDYVIEFDRDHKAITIKMNNARFDADMNRGLDIELRDINVKVNGNKFTFEVEAITPYIGDTPFPMFPITNLKGTFDFTGGLNMEFICTPRTAPGAYTVLVNTSFTAQPSDSAE